jgi:hypothetical protein
MKITLFFISFLLTTSLLSQSLILKTTKLEICDVYDNVLFVNDTCDVSLNIKNDTVLLKNLKTNHNSFYVFSEILESSDGFISWKCKDAEEKGVILFYLQEKQKEYYIFYIFFENQTYRYYCEKIQ